MWIFVAGAAAMGQEDNRPREWPRWPQYMRQRQGRPISRIRDAEHVRRSHSCGFDNDYALLLMIYHLRPSIKSCDDKYV